MRHILSAVVLSVLSVLSLTSTEVSAQAKKEAPKFRLEAGKDVKLPTNPYYAKVGEEVKWELKGDSSSLDLFADSKLYGLEVDGKLLEDEPLEIKKGTRYRYAVEGNGKHTLKIVAKKKD